MIIDKNFQTPEFVVDYMISLIDFQPQSILEPTPGLRNISKKLISENYNVIEPLDFFDLDTNFERFDLIVGNPPFSEKSSDLSKAPKDIDLKGMKIGYHILKECMKMSDNLIILMPWFTISDSDVRMRFLKDFGIVSVTPLPRKTFQYARIQTVVLHLKKGYTAETKFNTIFF